MNQPSQKENNTPVWLAIVIILVVAFLAWLVWQAAQRGETRVGNETTYEKPIPQKVLTLVGEVTSVGAQRFTMRAPAARNFFEQDKEFIIEIDVNTEFIISTPAHPSTGKLIDRNTGAFKDLKVGDQVSISSSSNIKDAASFKASKVEIVR